MTGFTIRLSQGEPKETESGEPHQQVYVFEGTDYYLLITGLLS